uniref:Uncharacterized protein n=1 Tax=Romanomermis culicivorax TaxID=13658 RepID=A0A915K3T9_ROMCU
MYTSLIISFGKANLAEEMSFVIKIARQKISTNPSIALITLSPVGLNLLVFQPLYVMTLVSAIQSHFRRWNYHLF